MGRLVVLFFMLPWWAYMPIAGGAVYLTNEVYWSELRDQAEVEQALARPVPEAVDLSVFDRDQHVGLADEVHVTGWINTDYNYTLVKRTNGVKTSERFMYMIFGGEDGFDAREVRAVLVLTQSEKDRFVEVYPTDLAADVGPAGALGVDLNGITGSTDGMASLIGDSIAEQGLVKAPEFIVIDPFLDGRRAGLSATANPDGSLRSGWLIALAIVCFGFAKRFLGFGTPKKRATDPIDPVKLATPLAPGGANKAYEPENYGYAVRRQPVAQANTIAPDSPLGRLAQRERAPEAGELGPEGVYPVAPGEVHAPLLGHGDRIALERAQAARETLRSSLSRKARRFGTMVAFVIAVAVLKVAASVPMVIDVLAGFVAVFALFYLIVGLGALAVQAITARAALSAAGGKSMLSALERQGVKGSDDRRVSVAALDSQPLAASSLKKPSRRQALASVLAVASVPERLSGTRAWVKQTGRKPASHGQAINADLGARMKSDPFDRLRAEVERLG
ncbi:hypothetical protein [uncultured Maritimibacter sp.]|jgi:hypothetical protein|uniref:hypothetical protein n=1 Tax=uncultured Maritimibacter sp. TaxID=991866 RepID=UPI00260CCC94|nr:hypothetical protein [uncultured Maritimibacter sp.]